MSHVYRVVIQPNSVRRTQNLWLILSDFCNVEGSSKLIYAARIESGNRSLVVSFATVQMLSRSLHSHSSERANGAEGK